MRQRAWILTSLLFLSACNDQASFKVIDEPTPGSPTVSDGDATADAGNNGDGSGESGSIKERCAQASLQEHRQTIHFENPGQVCEFGVGDNMSRVQLWFRARREQTVRLALPEGAVVCRMEFTFPEQPMTFDDEIFLLYDGVVLASSIDLSARFQATGSLSTYGWSRIRNTRYDASARNPFCLGAAAGLGRCQMPYTEQTGPMALSFDGALFEEIAEATKRPTHDFGFVTTGDNDNSDCQHAPLSFDVKAHYFL